MALMLELSVEAQLATGCSAESDYRLARGNSNFLYSLYKLNIAEPIGRFNEHVLSLLHQHIDFESAWLGQASRTPTGPRFHGSHLHNLDPVFLREYESIKDSDPLLQLESREAPDNTAATLALQDEKVPSCVRNFGSEQDIAHILFALHPSTMRSDDVHLSLFRGHGRDPYSRRDFYALQYTIQHIANVIESNRMFWVRTMRASAAYDAVAMFDEGGVLLHAEGPFEQIAMSEWPDWSGSELPLVETFQSLIACSGSWAGQCIIVSWEKVDGLLLVGIEAIGSIHRLTPRELAIARMYGDGLTYKQVARQLDISPATVRHHLRRSYEKLSVSNKGELIRFLQNSTAHRTAGRPPG